MKSIIIVALALVAVAVAVPIEEPTKIISSTFEQQPEGSYAFGFETDDGTSRSEQGQVKEAFDEDNKPHNVVVVRGTYKYNDVNGLPEVVNYYADETGYHAEGNSIPKPARR